MKVSDYVPKLYKNNLEMYNIINVEEIELESNLKPNIENRFKDSFATKATEAGISKFEAIFDIKYNPATEDLKFRRDRIMNRLISSIPYSERFLVNRLNELLGQGNWDYEIDYNNYTLTINSLIPGKNWYLEIIDFLNGIMPCNIDWKINIYSASWDAVRDTFATWQSVSEMTWEELMSGEWQM